MDLSTLSVAWAICNKQNQCVRIHHKILSMIYYLIDYCMFLYLNGKNYEYHIKNVLRFYCALYIENVSKSSISNAIKNLENKYLDLEIKISIFLISIWLRKKLWKLLIEYLNSCIGNENSYIEIFIYDRFSRDFNIRTLFRVQGNLIIFINSLLFNFFLMFFAKSTIKSIDTAKNKTKNSVLKTARFEV